MTTDIIITRALQQYEAARRTRRGQNRPEAYHFRRAFHKAIAEAVNGSTELRARLERHLRYTEAEEFRLPVHILLHLHERGLLESFSTERNFCGLSNVMHQYSCRLRDIEIWEYQHGDDILKSLVRHLFVQYEPLPFMYQYWYEGDPVNIRTVFLHVSQGGDLRNLPGKPRFTRAAIRHLLATPAVVPVQELYHRVWWRAWLLGNNACAGLIEAFETGTPNLEVLPSEWWEGFFRTLIREQFRAGIQWKPFMNFVWSLICCLGYEIRFVLDPERYDPAALATLASLWDEVCTHYPDISLTSWLHLDGSVTFADILSSNTQPSWSCEAGEFVSLRSVFDLAEEGKAMSHCVGGYYRQVCEGNTAIYSMRRRQSAGKTKRLLTLEVDRASSKLVQVKGFANANPEKEELFWVAEWMKAEKISAPRYLLTEELIPEMEALSLVAD